MPGVVRADSPVQQPAYLHPSVPFGCPNLRGDSEFVADIHYLPGKDGLHQYVGVGLGDMQLVHDVHAFCGFAFECCRGTDYLLLG